MKNQTDKHSFIVPISHTGRIVLPKIIREKSEIRRGEIVYFYVSYFGCIFLINESQMIQIKNESAITLAKLYLSKGVKSDDDIRHGFSVVENNFRVFIPKSFREYLSIENERKKWQGKVLIKYYEPDFITIWKAEYYKNYKKKIMRKFKYPRGLPLFAINYLILDAPEICLPKKT